LDHQSQELIARLGYTSRAKDHVSGFAYDYDFLGYLNKSQLSQSDWAAIFTQRPEVLLYWYRQSPGALIAQGVLGPTLTPGVVTSDDPPSMMAGMIKLWTDGEGRLQWFEAVPAEFEKDAPPQKPTQAVDWSPLFAAAEIDPAQLRPATPLWASLAAGDTRVAWDGTWPGSGRPLHVEAAAWHGKPVFFQLTGPWSKPHRTLEQDEATPGHTFGIALTITITVGGLFFAWRNLSRGRGDRKGASRLACAVFVVQIAVFLCRAHFSGTSDDFLLMVMAISTALFGSGVMWLLYIGLEPYVRRNWPQTIISWTRLMAGRVRDPLVGRDVIAGVLMGMAWVIVYEVGLFLRMRWGQQPEFPVSEYLLGLREAVAMWLAVAVNSILGTLMFFFVLVLLQVVVRNRWLAALLFVAIYTTPRVLNTQHPFVDFVVWLAIYGIAAIAVVRFGLIVLAIACFAANVLLNVPYSLDFSNWYTAHSLFIVLTFVAMGVWGFYNSLAGKTLLKDELFD
jgi:hypothetical protein